MFDKTQAILVILGFIRDNALIVGGILGFLMALLGALVGLRWGVSKFNGYVTGDDHDMWSSANVADTQRSVSGLRGSTDLGSDPKFMK